MDIPVENLFLSDEDLQITAIDYICNKFKEWINLSQDTNNGRQTRSTIRKAEKLSKEIEQFKAKEIIPKQQLNPQEIYEIKKQNGDRNNSNCSSNNSTQSQQKQPARSLRSRKQSSDHESDDDSTSSRPMTRSLRQRCRTPQQNQQPSTISRPNTRKVVSPCTPQNQKIRSNLHQPTSASSTNGGQSHVLDAALNQQHPSVSVTKIRQLLRADSAQKKQEEQLKRNEKIILFRKAKEERAEAQKKQLLEERAVNAKLKREQRLCNAAELRKQREDAKIQQRIQEERARLLGLAKANKQTTDKAAPRPAETCTKNEVKPESKLEEPKVIHDIEPKIPQVELPKEVRTLPLPLPSQPKAKPNQETNIVPQPSCTKEVEQSCQGTNKLNETFKKPNVDQVDNIDISIKDETTEEDHRDKVQPYATWTQSGVFREALIKQFDKSESERQRDIRKIFPKVRMPIQLDKIFPSNKISNAKYLVRTSSAVWTPPNKAIKRVSSMVLTPSELSKHSTNQ